MAAPWGNTKITGTSAAGPTTGQSKINTIKDIIRKDGSIYTMAINTADDYQFAISATKELDALKKSTVIAKKYGFPGNDFEYMQATLRSSGKSKGTSPFGSTDSKDYSAFRTLLKESYVDGVPWDIKITDFIKYGEKPTGTGLKPVSYNPTYSKDISTALKLIDSKDAEAFYLILILKLSVNIQLLL